MPAADDTEGPGGFDPESLFELKAELDEAEAAFKVVLPTLDAARRRYARSRTETDREALDAVQAETERLFAIHEGHLAAIREMLGISEEELAEIEAERTSGMDQLPRQALTADEIEPTADLDTLLPNALEAIESLLPSGWLEEEPAEAARLGTLFGPDGVLSITKGLRPESEGPPLHRLRQAVYSARDYLAGNLAYDHFAGATHVPTLVQFAAELEHLRAVGGDVEDRLRRLWAGASAGVDATFFELLTAARCVGRGRRVAFIQENSEKSPDLSCEDPFPLVIECKRQEPLSRYELSEERTMRDIFLRLRQLARASAVAGVFEVRLTAEAKDLDLDDVAATIFRQRLAARAEQALSYSWGTVAFRELPRRGVLPDVTRAYSPTMLEQVFGWNMDLPEWDGLCCSIANAGSGTVLDVQSPLGLLWSNSAPDALRKRTWAPTSLFGSATSQIYPGAVGIIYVAYVEGARAEAADMRVAAYQDRLREWEHGGDVRVPISVLCLLYPRPLGEGNPDLIESGVQVVSELYGDASLFDDFPTTIFTRSPHD